MKTVNIPGGEAVLREREDIKVRHRRLIEAASLAAAPAIRKLESEEGGVSEETLMEDIDLTFKEAQSLLDLQDATIVGILASWTLPEPLPTMDTVGDLDPAVYDALAQETKQMGAEIAKTSFEPTPPTEESPTSLSYASDGAWRAETPSQSLTPEQPNSGQSTDTGNSST